MKIDFKRLELLIPDSVPESIQELNPVLRLFNDDKLECWYVPLGRINKKAKIILYGITPGWTQMKIVNLGSDRNFFFLLLNLRLKYGKISGLKAPF